MPRGKPTLRAVFATGMACSLLAILNIFWDLGEGICALILLALALAALVIAVRILCGFGRRAETARRGTGWLLRPLAAACIVGPMLLPRLTRLDEHLFLWVHERHFRAVIRGEAGGEVRVTGYRDNVAFVIPRLMKAWYLVYELADAEPCALVFDPDEHSFWQSHRQEREIAHHLGGPWYSTWEAQYR